MNMNKNLKIKIKAKSNSKCYVQVHYQNIWLHYWLTTNGIGKSL